MGVVTTVINAIWFALDVLLVIAFFLHGYKYYKASYGMSKKTFYISTAIAFPLALYVMFSAGYFGLTTGGFFNHDAFQGGKLIAIAQNAIMSILFISLFFSRKKAGHPIEGQSFYVALAKLFGTSLTVGIGEIVQNPTIHILAALVLICFIFDTWYTVLIYKELKANRINPWKRI